MEADDVANKLDLRVKRIIRASDLALVTTEWSFSGTGSDGKHVGITSKSADVLRQKNCKVMTLSANNIASDKFESSETP